jgi:hypothetical protein
VNYIIQIVKESQDLKLQRYIFQLVAFFLWFEKKRKESENVHF